jgi:CRISPR-associated protein Csx3
VTYKVAVSAVVVTGKSADLYTVGFGDPASNDVIVKDATVAVKAAVAGKGGVLGLVNGPASLPVAVVIAHSLLHIYGAVAVFDPKLQGYVVAVSHTADFAIGDLIANDDVVVA